MTDKVTIRTYIPLDKDPVLTLLRLNTPKYFSPDEEKDLVHYLDHEIEHYFVIELDHKVIGCGGFNFSGNPALGKISWDILHPNYQGQALGTLLLNYRISELKKIPTVKSIIVRTSQHAYQFYEKNGFKLVDRVNDYWARGFDLYSMEYENKAVAVVS